MSQVLKRSAEGEPAHSSPVRGDTLYRKPEKESSGALVSMSGVSKTFVTSSGPIVALDRLSLDIAENAFFTLLGPSGCGKTTLLRLIAGFEHSDNGTLRIDGRDVVADPPHKRPVNIVFQSYALFPHLSVARNIAFGLERLGLKRGDIDARVDAMLALVRLDDLGDRKPAQLSGGQQQRVALARALAPNPKLVLLDEPLSALDLKLRRSMQVELKRIQRETGITFLLVTHDQEEALSMSDEIALMHEGRIVQRGTPRDLWDAPRTRFAADFLGANIVPGARVGLSCAHAAIRPERVAIATEGDGLPGTIVETTYLGASTAATITLDDGTTLKAEGQSVPALAAGTRVACRCPTDALIALED